MQEKRIKYIAFGEEEIEKKSYLQMTLLGKNPKKPYK